MLLVEDIQLVRQVCTWASVAFHDDSVADFFDRQVDQGRRPEQFGRVWVHTHPGDCPRPSGTDEATFDRVFGRSEWALMFIIACGGASYARLRFNVGPRAEIEIPVEVDYSRSFAGSHHQAWENEYLANVQQQEPEQQQQLSANSVAGRRSLIASPVSDEPGDAWYDTWFEYLEYEDPGRFVR